MTIENISISTKECCRPRRGLNLRPPGMQSVFTFFVPSVVLQLFNNVFFSYMRGFTWGEKCYAEVEIKLDSILFAVQSICT